jgi:protein-S-isoprenylcysteine O-methyltransferase Ste14
MNKLLFSVTFLIGLNILPLIGNPELIMHYKTIVIILEGLCLMLTQPKFSLSETKHNKQTDKFSIIFIFLASSISVVSAQVEWAYLGNTEREMNAISCWGIFIMLVGVSLRIWAINSLGRNFTATVRVNNEHQLIQAGPYAYIRHPSYTGAFLAVIGVAIFLNATVSICISIILMFTAYYVRIRSEEKLLVTHFGEEYSAYAKNKKKLFPYVW